ncbi:hypothetical protein D0856_28085 [Vibrio owensii]|uniref:hypothetical protein n=1 Tax=Vibrio owensii TaxID=696485 RepID=UPI000EFA3AAF|nr:hypothetical protein [Vibrio owensii]AYO23690.1 hypothetical protein D0856_28085 [Vibrio owensii]
MNNDIALVIFLIVTSLVIIKVVREKIKLTNSMQNLKSALDINNLKPLNDHERTIVEAIYKVTPDDTICSTVMNGELSVGEIDRGNGPEPTHTIGGVAVILTSNDVAKFIYESNMDHTNVTARVAIYGSHILVLSLQDYWLDHTGMSLEEIIGRDLPDDELS